MRFIWVADLLCRSATFACMGLWLGCLGVVLWAFSSRAPKGEEFHLEV